MNVEDKLYQAVHDYPGGAASLAPRMGVAVSTLLNMADPKQETHGWSLKRFRQLIAFAGPGPLHALCAENGGVFVKTMAFDGVSDGALIETLTRACKDFGEFAAAINETLTDGKFDQSHIDKISAARYELDQAAAELENRMRQLMKPAQLRAVS